MGRKNTVLEWRCGWCGQTARTEPNDVPDGWTFDLGDGEFCCDEHKALAEERLAKRKAEIAEAEARRKREGAEERTVREGEPFPLEMGEGVIEWRYDAEAGALVLQVYADPNYADW